MKLITLTTALCLSFLFISTQAFAFGSSPSKSTTTTSTSTPAPTSTTAAPAPTNLKVPGVIGPTLAVNGNYLSITVTLVDIQVDVGAEIPISGLPNSSIGISPDLATGGTDITVTLDFNDVTSASASGLIDPDTLPGGRPLPGVPAGNLPAIAVQLPKLDNAVVYLGQSIFGFFIPFDISVDGLIISAPYYNSAGTFVGALSVVGNDSNKQNGGFLLLLNDSSITKLLQLN